MEKWANILAIVGVFFSGLIILTYLLRGGGSIEIPPNQLKIISTNKAAIKNDDTSLKVTKLEEDLLSLKNNLNKISSNQKKLLNLNTQIKSTQKEGNDLFKNLNVEVLVADKVKQETKIVFKSLDNRMNRIESELVTNPEKALQLPFIRRDIDEIKNAIKENTTLLALLKEEIANTKKYEIQIRTMKELISSINSWMIAIIGGLLVSMVGIFTSNYLRAHKK